MDDQSNSIRRNPTINDPSDLLRELAAGHTANFHDELQPVAASCQDRLTASGGNPTAGHTRRDSTRHSQADAQS